MRFMTSEEIRMTWLNFFKERGHMIEPGASLIPHNDPSLLWINAGVAALKKYFDGSEIPECKRITNVQKCIRTNDIENVGMTARHQTIFEMLGKLLPSSLQYPSNHFVIVLLLSIVFHMLC